MRNTTGTTIDDYALSFVMAGGRGSRLEVLTKDRSKPAVNILGHYRIFDFVATNIANTSNADSNAVQAALP